MEHHISDDIKKRKTNLKTCKPARLVSAVRPDGLLIETLYDPQMRLTTFCLASGETWQVSDDVTLDGQRYLPYSPNNNLIRHGVVLFPSRPEPYDSEEALLDEIKAYLHTYIDLTPLFEEIAAYYVLLSWVYDGFKELPYLRVRGDYGSGKTRFLLILGSICYKPIFASGASTVSPLFRLLDAVGGTLILDECDFRMSDEKAQLTKILNNGNVRGFPVLRSEAQPSGEFDPQAYTVFGPKIVASRGWFDDRALESRFLTEEMGGRKLRPTIPLNLDDDYQAKALDLRNKLLYFRLRRLKDCRIDPDLHDPAVEPRLNQIFAPLLSIVRQPAVTERIRHLMHDYQATITEERGDEAEARVLNIIRQMMAGSDRPTVKAIRDKYHQEQSMESFEPVSPKWIGTLIRRRLRLHTEKRHGVYAIAEGQSEHLAYLFEKYGV